MARYALTIFLSAFLLFQVQPMIGKVILPWYGGGPAVWTACMLFFQVFLLGGYAYAHLVASRMTPRVGTSLHWFLLAASLLFLPIAPNEEFWKQATETAPVAQILALLSVTIGLPYFLLSSTGPLLQESFRRETGHPPYRLYALSNVGSLLALLTYPFVFEPQLKLRTQTWSWSGAYIAFAVLSAWCVLGLMRQSAAASDQLLPAGETSGKPAKVTPPSWRDITLWLALAACGSVLLLATTNQLCQEVTTVPFLWVVPLALYLTTFVICFDHERWYHRPTFLLLLIGALLAASFAMFEGTKLDLWKQIAAYCGALWVCCMVCHGELVRSKPAPQYATLFYLLVAAGGALGGVLVAVVAPLVLPDYWEYQIALCATVVLAFWTTNRDSAPEKKKPISVWIAGAGFLTAVALGIIGFLATTQAAADLNETNLETTRNFYGVLRVNKSENLGDSKGPYVELIHGRIRHGAQYLEEPLNRQPVTYYGAGTGISLALDFHPKRGVGHSPGDADAKATDEQRPPGTLRIGVIGLGCGTLAAYGQPGDTMRFYDINPEVVRIAQEYFTYCKDSAATVDIVLGDARINLERELAEGHPQKFDVLAVDAFSSDSIPMHLLTKECVELYRQHLAPDGLLCLHLSNQFLDLNGVARGMAEVLGVECVRVISSSDYDQGLDATTWVILTNNRKFLDSPELAAALDPWTDDDPPPLIWTDDYGSLWQVLDD